MRRVAVVEDDLRYRIYVEGLVRGSGEAGLVRGFGGAAALLADIEHSRQWGRGPAWDAVLVALEPGGSDGLGCVHALRSALPDARIVVLSKSDDSGTVLDALRAGADGYLLKHAPADRLLGEIRGACSGGAALGAEAAQAVVRALRAGWFAPSARTAADGTERSDLTPRELDVLHCLARGCSYRAAAEQLGIRVDTVRAHVRRVYAKLGVHSAAEAVGRAMRKGLI